MLLPIVLVGGVGYAIYHFATKGGAEVSAKPEHAPVPPAGPPVATGGGVRYRGYVKKIEMAVAALQQAKQAQETLGLPFAVGAAVELKGVLEVVEGMAKNDLAQGQITQADLDSINASIAEAKKLL